MSRLSWLLNTFLPNVIKDAIISSLPDKLGDLIHDEMTTIQLFGTINIRSDLPINIWQAKLHKDTSLGKFARSKLGITKDEADRLYFTTHHSAGRAAGFGSKLSMRGLHKFRLKYASCSDADVASLLDAVDRVANPKLERFHSYCIILESSNRITGLRLPPMIYYWDFKQILSPFYSIWISSFSSKE